MIPLKIAGSGIYRPRNALLSSELDDKIGRPTGWTQERFAIISRAIASADETSSFMGAQAIRCAMKNAGWSLDAPDVIIGACGVMEQPIPSTSVLIQQKLGLGKSGIPTFDINLTCLSFLFALDVAAMGISCGRWKRVVIVSSDIASAGLDYNMPEIASIFGDGAAAICIEATTDPSGAGILAQGFETYGDGHQLATLRSGGTRIRIEDGFDAIKKGAKFEMDTFGIFKAAAKCLPRLIDRVLAEAGHTRDSIDLIVCHQASAPAIGHVRKLFKSAPNRVVDIFATTGNQIATSIPTALCHALHNNMAKSGDHVLLLGTAAGVSAGAMLLRI
ncbi:MAG: 3-oxoacyl-ACP synthase [Alphaproteobacteria bacterium]|nr:3-oxoacyl-ACP synthase [Alphaproteobacteria bacterium]